MNRRIHTLPSLTGARISVIRSLYNEQYASRFPGIRKGLYRKHDWQRLEYCLTFVPPGTRSVLDVGTGPGALLNYLKLCGDYSLVTGVDVRQYSKFVKLTEALDFRVMNACKMTFKDAAYDVVICMEVLEHLDDRSFFQALGELRRVARKRLIISVPYNESLPLPSYHKQRFDDERLIALFPRSRIELLQRSPVTSDAWTFIVEDKAI